jgi:hypothetical protein
MKVRNIRNKPQKKKNYISKMFPHLCISPLLFSKKNECCLLTAFPKDRLHDIISTYVEKYIGTKKFQVVFNESILLTKGDLMAKPP